MTTIGEEPKFLADVVPANPDGTVNLPKRRAARIIHRGLLHHDPSISHEEIENAKGQLSELETTNIFHLHTNNDHALGDTPERTHPIVGGKSVPRRIPMSH